MLWQARRGLICGRSAIDAAGAGIASPGGVTGLLGWYDASVFASLTIAGSNVTAITDSSGAGNHLTSNGATTRPLYNATGFNTSYPTIDFSNANNSGYNKSGFALGTGNTLTMWFVGCTNAQFSQSNARVMSYGGGSGGQGDNDNNASFFVGQVGTTVSVQLNRNGSSASRTFTTNSTPHRFIATINSSGVMTAYVDGVSTTGSTLNAAFGATGDFWLGQSNPNNGNAQWHSVISEAGISTDFHDATAVAALDSYLQTKWGL